MIDILLAVADTSTRSLQTATDIINVAQGQGNVNVKKTGLIINRFTNERDAVRETAEQMDLEIFGYIPEDNNVTNFDYGVYYAGSATGTYSRNVVIDSTTAYLGGTAGTGND